MDKRGVILPIILVGVFLIIIVGSLLAYFQLTKTKEPVINNKPIESTAISTESNAIDAEFPYRSLAVSGNVTKTETAPKFELEYEFVLQKVAGKIPNIGGDPRGRERPYVIQVEKAGQVVGESEPFGICVPLQDIACSTEKDISGFIGFQIVSNIKGTPDSIVIRYKGEEVFRENESKNKPSVTLTSQTLGDIGVHLAWDGQDLDNDLLLYTVFMSEDNFQTMDRVHPDFYGDGEKDAMRKTSYDFSFSERYFKGGEIQFLVVVNDGFNLSWVITKQFDIPIPSYQLRSYILSPKEGEEFDDGFISLNAGLQVFIETPGYLYDGKPNTWSSIPHSYEWISSIDGLIASGDTDDSISDYIYCLVNDLNLGKHLLTYKASSPNGQAEASVNITIKRNPMIPADYNPPRKGSCK